MHSTRVSHVSVHRPVRLRPGRVLTYLGLVVVSAIVVFPMYWMVLSAIQPQHYILVFPPALWPVGFNTDPLQELIQKHPIGLWLWNSTILASIVTAICLVLTSLGAFALSRFRWTGKAAFGFLLLATQMMPGAVIIVPIQRLFRQFGMLENLPSLALLQAAFVLPIGIWILKGLFDSIPQEVVQAAYVDGCGDMGILGRILLPLSVPGLVAVGVVAFFFSWNEFLFANTMVTRAELLPASDGLATLISELDTPVQLLLAAAVIFSVLPVVFYLVVQRFIISGLTAGAVKG
ncbi:MAG: carbohydrate ABC transporter permease [Chloroflexota bacterium]|nr:carbohydrate ABC transporter permease [Chloroflexota bacterium]